MTSRTRASVHAGLSWVVVSAIGAVEGVYGRTQYLADWVSYLNVSRAVSNFDWKRVFDPMWTGGYPALIALARSLAPRTAEGEWYAITVLNLVIFLGAYASLRYLLQQVVALHDPSSGDRTRGPVLTWVACLLFLSCALCFDRVSRVAPDLLVSALFLLATSQMLRLIRSPSGKHAALLGLSLGMGCWVKGVFVSYAAIFFLTLVLASFTKKIPWRILAPSLVTFVTLLVPFVAAISWSSGHLTFGSSGALNYAFHVNHLPHWTNWHGGPPQFGAPLHPSVQLLPDLPVFAFPGPFASTYPPFNNLDYWYEGYQRFFSIKLQLEAIARNSYLLARVGKAHPIISALLIVLIAIAVKREFRLQAAKNLRTFWPLVLPAFLGLCMFLLVHLEGRYLAPLVLVLCLLPLTLWFGPEYPAKRSFLLVSLVAYVIGAGAELERNLKRTIISALHGEDFHRDPQWKLASALPSYGLNEGDTVALIGGELPNYRCSWAYVSRIQIAAEFGSLPWRIDPDNRTRFDDARAEAADVNSGQAFWRLSLDQRQRVIRAFQGVGVNAVLSLAKPESAPEKGWMPLGSTGAWIYRFPLNRRPQVSAHGPVPRSKMVGGSRDRPTWVQSLAPGA